MASRTDANGGIAADPGLPSSQVGTHLLPPSLLKLFTPRDPLPYAKPLGRDPDVPIHHKVRIDGVTPLIARLQEEQEEKGSDAVEKEQKEEREKFPELVTDTRQTAFEKRRENRAKRKEEKIARQEKCSAPTLAPLSLPA